MTSHFVNKISFDQEAVKKTKDEACHILKTMKISSKNKVYFKIRKSRSETTTVENADFSGRYHYL